MDEEYPSREAERRARKVAHRMLTTPPKQRSISCGDFGSTTSGLYALSPWTGSARYLYCINAATGAATFIGSIGLGVGVGAYGLSTGSSTLYFTNDNDANDDDLYSLNTTTGAATLIGNTGVLGGGLERWYLRTLPCTE